MRLYTSYYAKLKRLPNDIFPVAISATKPEGICIPRYTKLQPSRLILMKYKLSGDKEKYTRNYTDEILSKLCVTDVLDELEKISSGKDICFICYEKPIDFCHRHIVAKWFRNHGILCKEYTYEETS